MLERLRRKADEALRAACAGVEQRIAALRGIRPAPAVTTSSAATPFAASTVPTRLGAAVPADLGFDEVERRYGDHYALRGITMSVEPGEVVCLLGPSGCGKTTLLRVASGVEKPTSGRVLINGREVAGPSRFVPPEKRNVGLMFQDFALFPHLDILQNVAFGLTALPPDVAAREALALLTRVGLARYAHDYPHILSGGQQQRVALARAIAPRPSVVLMDEPFSGLDVQMREQIQEDALAMLREAHATSLLVTHHPEEAMRLADRIAVMNKGKLLQLGKAEELYRAPVDLFVARLFSEINEVKARVEGGLLRTPLGSFSARGLAEGSLAVVCFRYRSFRFLPKGQGLPARVRDIKFLGDVAQLEIVAAGFERPLKARALESRLPPRDEDIGLAVDEGSTLVFAAEGPTATVA